MGWKLQFQGRGKSHATLQVTQQISLAKSTQVRWLVYQKLLNYFMLIYTNGVWLIGCAFFVLVFLPFFFFAGQRCK